MSLIKWKPLNNQIDTFDNVLDQFFNDFAFDPRFSLTTNQPYSYMNENKKEYYLNMDLPGLEKEDINARVENNHVIVSGERKNDSINNNFYGKFEQIFKIPENVKVDKIKASLKNGVLNITFPKDKNAIGKEIDIKIS
jgi:HSP20 family protein|tara:strand:- start:169 stop:582 length:414 start_codon:yes stop_codon:yes gene_type:complete